MQGTWERYSFASKRQSHRSSTKKSQFFDMHKRLKVVAGVFPWIFIVAQRTPQRDSTWYNLLVHVELSRNKDPEINQDQ